jgi:hypothetical protein
MCALDTEQRGSLASPINRSVTYMHNRSNRFEVDTALLVWTTVDWFTEGHDTVLCSRTERHHASAGLGLQRPRPQQCTTSKCKLWWSGSKIRFFTGHPRSQCPCYWQMCRSQARGSAVTRDPRLIKRTAGALCKCLFAELVEVLLTYTEGDEGAFHGNLPMLRTSITDRRNMWQVPMEGFHTICVRSEGQIAEQAPRPDRVQFTATRSELRHAARTAPLFLLDLYSISVRRRSKTVKFAVRSYQLFLHNLLLHLQCVRMFSSEARHLGHGQWTMKFNLNWIQMYDLK